MHQNKGEKKMKLRKRLTKKEFDRICEEHPLCRLCPWTNCCPVMVEKDEEEEEQDDKCRIWQDY